MSRSSVKNRLETLQGWLIQLARGNKNPRNVKKRVED
jgi:hypothetical protein